MQTKASNLHSSSARLDEMQAKKYSATDLEKIHSDTVEKLTKEKKFFIPRQDAEKQIKYTGYYEKLADYFFHKNMDPELYFGLLTLHYIKNKEYYEENKTPCMASTAPLVSSDKAIKICFAYMKYIEKDGADAKKYLESHYIQIRPEDIKLSKMLYTKEGLQYVKETIMQEIIRGEEQIKTIQDRRNLNRWDALVFCIDFNMVSDIYTLACKEFTTKGDEIVTFRWRLEEIIRDNSVHKLRFKKIIKEISELYYKKGITEVPKLPKNRRYKKPKLLHEDIN